MAKRILLADDSITIQKVVELTFSDGDYEVIATNNGAKAIQKLSEVRPDIILSDIIMPEKNGYEVCEYVKSHPDFRTIPVILLTGTFEPFDPDRAEKAGCDAVVTKPFESQSLIQKVEELIEQSRASASPSNATQDQPLPPELPETSPPPPEVAAAPDEDVWESRTTEAPFPAPLAAAPLSESEPAPSPFPAEETSAASDDPFGAEPLPMSPMDSPPPPPAIPLAGPSDASAYSGETRVIPKMTFADLQRLQSEAAQTEPPSAAPLETSDPFADAPAPPPPFASPEPPPSLPFDNAPPLFTPPPPPPPAPFSPPAMLSSDPFGENPDLYSGATRAIPKMSFADLQAMQQAVAPTPPPMFEQDVPPPPPPFQQPVPPEPDPYAGATRAIPKLSLEDLHRMAVPAEDRKVEQPPMVAASDPWATPEPDPQPVPSVWSDGPAAEKGSYPDEPAAGWTAPVEQASAAETPWSEPPVEEAAESWPAPAENPVESWSPTAGAGGLAEVEPAASVQPEFASPFSTPVDDELSPRAQFSPSDPVDLDEQPAANEPAPLFETAALPSREEALFETAPAEQAPEPLFETSPAPASEPEPVPTYDTPAPASSPQWSPTAEVRQPDIPSFQPHSPAPEPARTSSLDGGSLTEAQIDQIARRVVELISHDLVRNIAWEVIPDLADHVVRERIRQLEAEA